MPGRSNAFLISKRLGLSDDIIDKAKNLLTEEQIKFEDMLQKIEKNIQQTESDKIKTEALKLEIERMQKELALQKDKFKSQRDALIKEAKLSARHILEDAKEEASKIINEMRKASLLKEESEKNKELEKNRLRLKQKMDSIDESLQEKLIKTITPKASYTSLKVSDLKIGDTVHVTNLNKDGTVVEINSNNNEVLVLVGILKITCHISNLRKVAQKPSYGKGVGTRKTQSVTSKIDVRGNNLEEAIFLVDKYLDDVSMSNLSSVTIVHGKGTGVFAVWHSNIFKEKSSC